MSVVLLSIFFSLALLSSGATVSPIVRGLALDGGPFLTNPNGTVDHDGVIMHSIDVYNKYQRNMRILDQNGDLPDGWKITEYKTMPVSLQKRANGGAPLTLGGPPGPLWTARIAVGTPIDPTDPPSTYTVLIDTGSCDLWIPDVQCGKDCKGKSTYDSDKSTTAKQISGAKYMHSYADGLKVADGDVFTDVVVVASARANPLFFGTAKDVESGPVSYLTSPFDGILGLAFPKISQLPANAVPPVPALFQQGQITANAFSLRLSTNNAVSEMFLGGTNPAKFAGAFELHPVVQTGGFWQVAGGAVVVGGNPVLALQSVILDSGANFIFGDSASVQKFYNSIPGSKVLDPTQGTYAFPCASQLPAIGFMFGAGNRLWTISPATFNIGPISSNPSMCMGGIAADSLGFPANTWVLGGVFLQNVYTQFLPGTFMVGFATPV